MSGAISREVAKAVAELWMMKPCHGPAIDPETCKVVPMLSNERRAEMLARWKSRKATGGAS